MDRGSLETCAQVYGKLNTLGQFNDLPRSRLSFNFRVFANQSKCEANTNCESKKGNNNTHVIRDHSCD